ncbi:site-specific integrase [Streptomyces aidingensis]|uniref:site-specific integrase n=1 Tax=Streptomyces aidingensis TaxID=910347 RepID=UPI001587B634|nr:site-specific integrase [Streptomyces aidingensis]
MYDARGRRRNCRKDHGAWYYVADVGTGPDGKRKQVRKGGFRTADDAEKALAELLARVGEGTYTHDEGVTVAQWLARWLDMKERAGLRPATLRAYRSHITLYLEPRLGRLRLRDLRPSHVDRLLADLANGTRKAATVRRVHATLRSALSSAVKQRLVTFNAAKDIELPKAERPKARPWEPAELGAFLDSVGTHRLGALFEVIAGTGMRRGEAVGLRWEDVDLARRIIVVRQQVVQESGRKKNKQPPAPCPYCDAGHLGVSFGKPKTASGENRVIDLDEGTVGALIAHRLRQDEERKQWGDAYADHGLVFAREDGNPLRPDEVTKLFVALVDAAGLRRVRLHDLRHGQASLMLAAGVELAIVSKRLGHSSIAITSDTYSHLLGGVGRDAADRASALIPRARRTAPDAATLGERDHLVTTPAADGASKPGADPNEPPLMQVNEGPEVDGSGRPCGTRTHNQRIKSPEKSMPPTPGRCFLPPLRLVSMARADARSTLPPAGASPSAHASLTQQPRRPDFRPTAYGVPLYTDELLPRTDPALSRRLSPPPVRISTASAESPRERLGGRL